MEGRACGDRVMNEVNEVGRVTDVSDLKKFDWVWIFFFLLIGRDGNGFPFCEMWGFWFMNGW